MQLERMEGQPFAIATFLPVRVSATTTMGPVLLRFAIACSLSQALATLCGEKDGIRDLTLPQHWMRDFFLAHLCLEMQHNAEGLSRLQVQHARSTLCL